MMPGVVLKEGDLIKKGPSLNRRVLNILIQAKDLPSLAGLNLQAIDNKKSVNEAFAKNGDSLLNEVLAKTAPVLKPIKNNVRSNPDNSLRNFRRSSRITMMQK